LNNSGDDDSDSGWTEDSDWDDDNEDTLEAANGTLNHIKYGDFADSYEDYKKYEHYIKTTTRRYYKTLTKDDKEYTISKYIKTGYLPKATATEDGVVNFNNGGLGPFVDNNGTVYMNNSKDDIKFLGLYSGHQFGVSPVTNDVDVYSGYNSKSDKSYKQIAGNDKNNSSNTNTINVTYDNKYSDVTTGCLGDPNMDGEIGVADVNACIDMIAGNIDAWAYIQQKCADVNKDEQITIADINKIVGF